MGTFINSPIENCKEKFSKSTKIENENYTTYNSNKREGNKERSIFYKKPIKKNNYKLEVDFNETPQEIRRQRLLYYQKKNRDACFNAGRRLLEDVFNFENEVEMEAETEENVEGMEVDHVKKRNKFRKKYANTLMLSEWMFEVPQDFAEKWIMVPCPLGKRAMIIACKGITNMYSRQGDLISTFKTVLPGGSPRTSKNNCTILDCILLENIKTCYVLDVLAWSNQEMLNCEAEFRFYWLKSQLEELNELKEIKSKINEYQILPLPTISCDQNFYKFLESISKTLLLDGLLFYHKEAHYVNAKTPLVTWLKTYMLPEILNMNVPEPYNEKPEDYIDFEHHVLKVIEKEKEIKEKKEKAKQIKKFHKKQEQEVME